MSSIKGAYSILKSKLCLTVIELRLNSRIKGEVPGKVFPVPGVLMCRNFPPTLSTRGIDQRVHSRVPRAA